MPRAFDLEQAKELVLKVGLTPLFETYLGSPQKHKVRCSCGTEFDLLFSTINRRLKENPNYVMRCRKCNDSCKDTKYTAEVVFDMFQKHGATPLFTKEFWEESSRNLIHRDFGRLHLDYLCACGKKDWTLLENLITKINKNPEYVLGCQSCCARQGKQIIQKRAQIKQWVLNYFLQYNLKVENIDEIEKNTSKIVFYCACGNIHQTTWMSLQQCQTEPRCLQCQIKAKPRGEQHPNWDVTLSDEERKKANEERPLAIKVWSNILRIMYGFKCQISGEICRTLNCHHIYPCKIYKEKRFEFTNGIPIDSKHHVEFHSLYGKHTDNNTQFFSFFKERTGRDLIIPENILPVLIHDNSQNLLNMKKSYALRNIDFIPVFLEEAIVKPNIIASMLRSRFGLITDKVNARDLIVKEIFDSQKISRFLTENHRQGEVPAVVNIGLETSEGELISLMTFGEPRFAKQHQFELLRFCSKINTVVHGAAQRLFSFFVANFKPTSIISYADLRYSSYNPERTLYHQLGFQHTHYSHPNYWYTKDFVTLESRQKYQKHKLPGLLPVFDASLSEEENMLRNGFVKIEDCGNHVFVWQTK